jgi:TolA-binding protein
MDLASALISAGSSVIVGILALVGVMITNNHSNNKMQNEMRTAQAVTDERIDELTREVRTHNDFASRIPVLEEKIKVVNRRIEDLEQFHKPN